MRKGYAWILAVFVCAASEAQQPAAPYALDHFKIWKVTSVPFRAQVDLLGQFDRGRWWRASVANIQYLANPTNKTHVHLGANIANPDLHYVGYNLTPSAGQPRRNVVLRNQFTLQPGAGDANWLLGDPALLLVPAGKTFPPAVPQKPDSADHFVCYRVRNPVAFPQNLTLEDQFDVRRRRVETITQLEPAYFCVPAQKRFGNHVEEPLRNAQIHLAIYRITPAETLIRSLRPRTADQFGTRRLEVKASEMLAVPSVKLSWEAAQ